MTVPANLLTNQQDQAVCVFEHEPLVPFYKRDRMLKAKYLQWIIDNVNADSQVKVQEREHPKTNQMENTYSLNHLVRIAGQYPDLHAAKCAMGKLNSTSLSERAMMNSSSLPRSDPDKSDHLETLLDSITVVWNKQRWITIADFFKYVFPRLRPSQHGYLPCIYRTHIQMNGELVRRKIPKY